jgi:hypothetical protein
MRKEIDAQNGLSNFTYNIKVNRLSWSLEIQNIIARNSFYLLCTAGDLWREEILHCDLETADAVLTPHNSRHRKFSIKKKISSRKYLSVYSIKDTIFVVICLKAFHSGYDPASTTEKTNWTHKTNTKHFRLFLCSFILKGTLNFTVKCTTNIYNRPWPISQVSTNEFEL